MIPSLHDAPFNAILWYLIWTLTYSSPSSSPFMSLSNNTLLSIMPHNEVQFLLLYSERWRNTILICCMCKIVFGLYLACSHFYLLRTNFLACAHFFDNLVLYVQSSKMRAWYVFLMQTCLHLFWRHSSYLRMMLSLPIFWRKHRPTS